ATDEDVSTEGDTTPSPGTTSSGTTSSGTTTVAGPVTELARWLASGFTLLAGVLTFFGVKEDVLDRALVQFPYAAMLVFCLVGGAVVAAVAVAVLPTTAEVTGA